MVFGGEAAAGRSTRTRDTADDERNRFSLQDTDILELARSACAIEQHYGRPMDIEWAKDGEGKIYILQRGLKRCVRARARKAPSATACSAAAACSRPGARSATRSASVSSA
jgi:hypothetical protein